MLPLRHHAVGRGQRGERLRDRRVDPAVHESRRLLERIAHRQFRGHPVLATLGDDEAEQAVETVLGDVGKAELHGGGSVNADDSVRQPTARFSTLRGSMATLDSLPADQRAVLQLVLGRGRSYDDIGAMLSIDRAAVRERALGALDALGPDSDLDPVRRGSDHRLPARAAARRAVAREVSGRLAEHPDERAWARVVAGELVPLGADRLPEIPAAATPAPAPVARRPHGGRSACRARDAGAIPQPGRAAARPAGPGRAATGGRRPVIAELAPGRRAAARRLACC